MKLFLIGAPILTFGAIGGLATSFLGMTVHVYFLIPVLIGFGVLMLSLNYHTDEFYRRKQESKN